MTKSSNGESAKSGNVGSESPCVNPPTLIFVGTARLPASAVGGGQSDSLSVELEIDPYDETIVDASCTYIPRLGEKLLASILIGQKLPAAIEEAIVAIRARYFGGFQRALIAALEDLLRRHGQRLKDRDNPQSDAESP